MFASQMETYNQSKYILLQLGKFQGSAQYQLQYMGVWCSMFGVLCKFLLKDSSARGQHFLYNTFVQTVQFIPKTSGLALLHSIDGSTWNGHTFDPCATRVPRPSKLSDPHFLPLEFPKFGHCRGVTPGRVFQPATKPPGIWKSTRSWRGEVDLREENQFLNYILEAVPDLN